MTIVNRALLPLVLVGCWTSRPSASPMNRVETVGRAICPQDASLTMLKPDLVTDLRLEVHAPGGVVPDAWKGLMVVDGTVTDAPWPEHAPQVYALPDGRRLLYDAYNANVSYLWEPAARTLTPLGKAVPVPVGRQGHLLTRHTEDGSIYLDVDPTRPALREIWRAPSSHHIQMLGVLDGTPVAMKLPYDAYETESRKKRRAATLVCMLGPSRITTRELSLPAGLYPSGDDVFRGHRMLLRGASDFPDGIPGGWMTPFSVGIYILDLDKRGHAREIGTVPGSYTRNTAVPHPYVIVKWGPPPPGKDGLLVGWNDDTTHYVDPESETIH